MTIGRKYFKPDLKRNPQSFTRGTSWQNEEKIERNKGRFSNRPNEKKKGTKQQRQHVRQKGQAMAVSHVEMRERTTHEILALLRLPLRLDDLSTCKKISFYKLVWEENCVELKLKEFVGVSGVQRCAEWSSCAEGWLNSGPKGALVKRTINAGKSRKMGIHSTELNTALSVKYIDMSLKTQSVCTSRSMYLFTISHGSFYNLAFV